MAEPRAGLLRQMEAKLGRAGEGGLPAGAPPDTLQAVLLSDHWYPAFLAFLRDSLQLAGGGKREEAGRKLVRECGKMLEADKGELEQREGRKNLLKKIKGDCPEGLDTLVQQFLVHVEKQRKGSSI
jgi:hypothetical protein